MAKLIQSKYQPIIVLLSILTIGAMTVSIPKVALGVGLFLFIYGWLTTVLKRNLHGEAHLFSAMIVGSEVYFKMSFSGLPWEFSKIAVIILLLTGMAVERKKRPIPIIILVYSLLLVPALFVPDWKDIAQFKHDVMMNLSGEISLIIAVLYFYKRTFTQIELIKFGRMLMYGVILMAVMVFLKSPDYGAINYGGGSNFAASGGFGPNQVGGIFGLGIFVSGFFLLQNIKLFLYKWVDVLLLAIFSLQSLFTLSRGGLFGSIIALVLSIIVLYIFNPKQTLSILKINPLKIVFLGLISVLIFIQADSISGGAVFKRYFNIDKYGNQIKEDYSTHRLSVVETDLETFKEYWITGAGVGGGATYRESELGFGATHVEFSRLLADHGILGVLILIIMFVFPLSRFLHNGDARTRMLLVGFISLALLTMSHNAMRLSMTGFLYGFGFVSLIFSIQNEKLILKIKGQK